MKRVPKPPGWAERFLESVCDPAIREDLLGDLHERFMCRVRSKSMLSARLLYIWDVFVFLKPYTIRKDRGISVLLLVPTYMRNARRSILNDGAHSFFVVFGLTISILAFVFIALYVNDELKYDRHYDKAERIYKITSEIRSSTASTPVVGTDGHLGQRLKDLYPEVEQVVEMVRIPGKTVVKYKSQVFLGNRFYKAESTYFRIFSHNWLAGDPESALRKPKSVVLTETLARKYFNDRLPLDETISIDGEEFTVTGLIEDLPSHTDLIFDALLSTDHEYLVETDYWCQTFILARHRLDEISFQQKLDELSVLYLQSEVAGTGAEMSYRIEQLPDVHFGSTKLFDTPKSSRSNIYIFSVFAFFIILIACINYINMAVVKALRKTAEAGMRKVLGASSLQLVVQYLCESFILCGVSILLAGLSAYLLLPYFNHLTGKRILLAQALSPEMLLIFLGLLVIMLLISGLYPATVWSSARTILVGKGRNTLVTRSVIRNVLIVIQFTISIGLMISTDIVYDQWKLLSVTNPGFDKEQIVVVDVPNDDGLAVSQIKNNFSALPFVKQASLVGYNSLPTSSMDIDGYEVIFGGEDVTRIFNNITVDENLVSLLGIELLQGRNFTAPDLENEAPYVVVNESFVKAMDWHQPLEQVLYMNSTPYEVIGVVKDFHFNSLHKKIEPIVIHSLSGHPEKIMVKVDKADFKSLQLLEDTWTETTKHPMEFEFLDAYVDTQYKNEDTMQRVLLHFAVVTLFIACLGLSGLVALTTAGKSREYAIRRILGAGFPNIIFLVTKEFTKLVLIGVAIAVPTALFISVQWLQQFPYKTDIDLVDSIWSGMIAVALAIVSIGCSSFRMALAKPVQTIKSQNE